MSLEQLLSQSMGETGLRIGQDVPSFHALRKALGEDPEMRAAATALIETNEGVLQRDHIARWRTDLIRRALENPDDSGGC